MKNEIGVMAMEDKSDGLRMTQHNILLSNQAMIEFAYLCKDVIEYCYGHKLFFEQANCYSSCFYRVRKLLKMVTPEYLELHSECVSFFTEKGDLSADSDRLYFVKESTEPSGPLCF